MPAFCSKPNGSQMVPSWIAVPAAALGDAGLRERLGDLQALALERVGRDHVDLADAGDAGRDRGEVVDVAAEADVGQDLAAELDLNVSPNTLALPIPALVFS